MIFCCPTTQDLEVVQRRLVTLAPLLALDPHRHRCPELQSRRQSVSLGKITLTMHPAFSQRDAGACSSSSRHALCRRLPDERLRLFHSRVPARRHSPPTLLLLSNNSLRQRKSARSKCCRNLSQVAVYRRQWHNLRSPAAQQQTMRCFEY